jgi:hypothetical protein
MTPFFFNRTPYVEECEGMFFANGTIKKRTGEGREEEEEEKTN